jgi:hypothetical protein
MFLRNVGSSHYSHTDLMMNNVQNCDSDINAPSLQADRLH